MRKRRLAVVLAVSALISSATSVSFAGEPRNVRMVVWPTMTPAGDGNSKTLVHRAVEADGPVYARAQELDATLRDAVQDLGFQVDLSDGGPEPSRIRDEDLLQRAGAPAQPATQPSADAATWVVSGRLEALGSDQFLLRLLVALPGGKEIRTRVVRVAGADVAAQGLVLLRDMLATSSVAVLVADARVRDRREENVGGDPPRSAGRAVLAVHGAVFGGFSAFALQRASGSDDPRVLYPLLALGTGVGLGTALLASAEWDVTTGNAWYVTAGSAWGTFAGVALANGAKVGLSDRFAWGVAGGFSGLGLVTLALIRNKMDEGDAVLTHSGGALGAFGGGAVELFVRGTLGDTPRIGSGLGAAVGLVSMGTVSILTKVAPGRVMLIDLGAGLGALAGAAASSPLLFENITPGKTRGFVGVTMLGTVVGAGTGWYLTRDTSGATRPGRNAFTVRPGGGVIGASETRTGPVPAYGASLTGTF